MIFKEVFLDNISESERRLIKEGLNYPVDSAGRLMQREFVSIDLDWNVGDAIDFLRKKKSPRATRCFFGGFLFENVGWRDLGSPVLTCKYQNLMLLCSNPNPVSYKHLRADET